MAAAPAGPAGLLAALVLTSSVFGLADLVLRDPAMIRYYIWPVLRLPEFALGIVLGLRSTQPLHARPWAMHGLSLAGAGALLLLGVASPLIGLIHLPWNHANFIVVPATAWLLYATARLELQARPAWQSLPSRIMVYLGESSFCLFLAHLLPLMWLDSPDGKIWLAKLAAHDALLSFWLLFVVASLGLAASLHELVEKPARRALLRSIGSERNRPPESG